MDVSSTLLHCMLHVLHRQKSQNEHFGRIDLCAVAAICAQSLPYQWARGAYLRDGGEGISRQLLIMSVAIT